MHPLIEHHRNEILVLAKQYGIENVRVFGSMARGDANDASDVDLLISVPEGVRGLEVCGLLVDMQDLLQRKVDLVTDRSLHPMLRETILKEAQSL